MDNLRLNDDVILSKALSFIVYNGDVEETANDVAVFFNTLVDRLSSNDVEE